MQDVYIIVAILVIVGTLSALVLRVRFSLAQKAVSQVIEILRDNDCSRNPKTLDTLGLRLPDSLIQLGRQKDYRAYALYYLIEADVVRVVEDKKICLVEENLIAEASSDEIRESPKNDEPSGGQAHRVIKFPIRQSHR